MDHPGTDDPEPMEAGNCDRLSLQGGDDTGLGALPGLVIDGGSGLDRVVVAPSVPIGPVDVTLGDLAATQVVAGLTLVSVERFDWVPSAGDDRFRGVDGGVFVLYGRQGHDTLPGASVDDILGGGHGVDRLFGAGGNDRLFAGVGDDILIGRLGHDGLYGGAGADVFTLSNPEPGAAARITDVVRGTDLIRFPFWDDVDLVVGASPAARSRGVTLVFDTDTSALSPDMDGTGSAAQVLIVTVHGVTALDHRDHIFFQSARRAVPAGQTAARVSSAARSGCPATVPRPRSARGSSAAATVSR